MTLIRVPDSIEPVIGWRSLDYGREGRLFSPTYHMMWAPGVPVEAQCRGDHLGEWRWIVSHDKPPTSDEEIKRRCDERKALSGGFGFYMGPAGAIMMHGAYISPPPRPQTKLFRGNWVLEWHLPTHQAPDQDCHCGIHIAGSKDQALAYSGSLGDSLFALTAGWGKVIPGDLASRCQFAYPQSLWLVGVKPRNVPKGLRDYGIPVYCVPSFESVGVAQEPIGWEATIQVHAPEPEKKQIPTWGTNLFSPVRPSRRKAK